MNYTSFCAILFNIEAYKPITLWFVLLGLMGALTSFLFKAAILSGDIYGIMDPQMLGLLWSTQSGTAMLWQLIGLILNLIGLCLRTYDRWVSAIGGIIAISSFLVAGHIHDHESILITMLLLLHLVAVSVWIGILIPLYNLAKNESPLVIRQECLECFTMLLITAMMNEVSISNRS